MPRVSVQCCNSKQYGMHTSDSGQDILYLLEACSAQLLVPVAVLHDGRVLCLYQQLLDALELINFVRTHQRRRMVSNDVLKVLTMQLFRSACPMFE